MPYSGEAYLDLFEESFLEAETPEERLEALRHGNVFRYRAKIYRMGDVLECELFPIWNTQQEATRAKKARESRAAQVNLNHRNTQKNCARLIENNFTDADLWGTFGYDKDKEWPTAEQAHRDLVNFIRRLKRRRKELGLPPMRYAYATEVADKDGKPVRPHHHIVMPGDMDRDLIENEWHRGDYPQTRRLRAKDKGLKGLAFYITKGKKGQRLWGHSKNLKKPQPSVADKKITKRQAETIAIDRNTAPDFFTKAFKGYTFWNTEMELDIRHSRFVAGAYIYARMHRCTPKRDARKAGKTMEKLKTKDVAKDLEISYKGLLSLLKKGVMPSEKVNGRWVITPEDYKAFKKQNEKTKNALAVKYVALYKQYPDIDALKRRAVIDFAEHGVLHSSPEAFVDWTIYDFVMKEGKK